MEQIKAHIAVSLDGHTATPDYELDWLPDKVKAIIGKYYLDADCLLMGANTYNYIFEHWGGWPHKSKRSFVVSHYDTNVTPDCGVEFLTEEPLQRVYELKQKTDILVVGGGKRIFKMAPIHHHFELCGWSETRVVAVFAIVTAILCMVAYLGL